MNKNVIVTVLGALSICANSYAFELKNLDFVKKDYIKYYDSGKYTKDQQHVGDAAINYLKWRLQQSHQKPYAIVLDIDETSLSNYPDMLDMHFGGTDEQQDAAEDRADDPAITSILKVYQFAKSNHIAIFFVTGRREKYRESTVKNLKDVGYDSWEALYLKPMDYHDKSASPYKTKVRSEIENKGYDIVLNMGDQQSDLAGGHADKTFKMPNPYYFIP